VSVTFRDENSLPPARPGRVTFAQDFKRFFVGGLAALLPTLITLWLLVWAWNFLWESIGIHVIIALKWLYPSLAAHLTSDDFFTKLLGVLASMVLVYIIGFFVGNLIGRTFWKLGERLVMRIPIIRAIYPAVKQVTDFVLANRGHQFDTSRVVAVQPHEKGIWSIGLITGPGLGAVEARMGEEMVTVFVPSSPTAFSGYVLVVPRSSVIELPLTVEEAMRLLVSGGVVTPAMVPENSVTIRLPAQPPVPPQASSRQELTA
jgi:uncharacterized membrane protein